MRILVAEVAAVGISSLRWAQLSDPVRIKAAVGLVWWATGPRCKSGPPDYLRKRL